MSASKDQVFTVVEWLHAAKNTFQLSSATNVTNVVIKIKQIAGFEPMFARSASAATPIVKKSSIRPNTNRKSTMRFPMSVRWSSYVAPKS